jgi:hypothetical protein
MAFKEYTNTGARPLSKKLEDKTSFKKALRANFLEQGLNKD